MTGNNENEAAIATNWWNTDPDKEVYENDYRKLYIDVIMNIVKKLDMSRTFLSSSPTNGLESMKEDWIAKNPYDLLVKKLVNLYIYYCTKKYTF